MGEPLATFEVARFRFSLRVTTPLQLPQHSGSAFRGGFGHVFRKLTCPLGCKAECQRPENCTYAYVFETPAPAGSRMLAEAGSAPRPFVIEPLEPGGRLYRPGEHIGLGLVLIGRAIGYLPYFIYAFDELGRVGLGPARGGYDLEAVECEPAAGRGGAGGTLIYNRGGGVRPDAEIFRVRPGRARGEAPPPGCSLTVDFLSPTQLQFEHSRQATGVRFHVLFRNLLRRVNFLNYFHCGGELLEDVGELIRQALSIQTEAAALEWSAWERYSARQSQRVPMRGFTGRVTYRGDFAPFWPWLVAGEWVHVGKAATFGLGRYALAA